MAFMLSVMVADLPDGERHFSEFILVDDRMRLTLDRIAIEKKDKTSFVRFYKN